jgi:hypothetical protein
LKSKEISFSFISERIAVALRFCSVIDGLCDFSVEINVFWRYSISFSVNDEDVFSRFCISFYFVTITDDGVSLTGTVNFTKIMSDGYEVKGNAKSGKNILIIDGKADRVSPKHINFYGKITQTINDRTESKSNSNTFRDEGKGDFFRLQQKINAQGFVDYIDIWK